MTKEELKRKKETRARWLDEETRLARNKVFMGQALTKAESQKIFNYLRRLENTLDKINDLSYNLYRN